MNSVTPGLLALLLVTSLLAMPVLAAGPERATTGTDDPSHALQQSPTQQGSVATVENTTNRLRLVGDVREEHAEYGPDIGLTLATTDDQLRLDQEQYTIVDSEFVTASPEEREEMVRTADNHLKDRIEHLGEREREAVRAHANGESTDAELLQTLLRNHNQAAVLSDALDDLDDRTDDIPGWGLSKQQLDADKALLDLHRTSLRSSLERTSQPVGTEESHDVRIRTSENGYSLSMIDGETYLLETVRFDNRDADASNQFEDSSISETIEHTLDHYPWAREQEGFNFHDRSYENLYVTTIDFDQSQLKVFLDAGSADVYREHQELALESLPEEETTTWSDDGLEVTLSETPANGPAQVSVVDTATDEPATATISVDGTEIGPTDDDGTLWFVPPTTEYELRAETDAGNVTETVAPT